MKKFYFIAVLLLFCVFGMAQTNSNKGQIDHISKKVALSKQGERLKWMDSLSRLARNAPGVNYDSIVKKTIAYAIDLDSMELAGRQMSNLIDYKNLVVDQPEQGLKLFTDFIRKYKTQMNNKALGELYITGADSYYFSGDIDQALVNYKIAKNYAKKAANDRLIGLSSLYAGNADADIGLFSEASINFQDAIESFIRLKDTFNIIGSKIGLSILYSQVMFLKEAEIERNEAIVLAKQIKAYNSLVSLYFNAATDFRFIGDTQKRVDNIEAALAVSDSANVPIQTRHLLYTNLVVACVENKDLSNAELYFKEVLKYPELNISGKSRESYIEAQKFLLYARGQLESSALLGEEYLTLKLARGQFAEILQAYKFLNTLNFELGNKAKAYDYLERYTQLKDSIRSAENVKSLAFYQTLYETEKRNQKIKTQESAIELLNAKDEIKNQYILFGSLGVFALFGFILLMRSKNKAKQTQLLQEQFSQDLLKSQESERIRIAKDLHDSVGQQLTLIKQKSQNAQQDDISKLTHLVLEDIRGISRGLYPAMLRQLGLSESIEQLVYDYDEDTDLFFSSDIDSINAFFDEDQSLNIYRCMQESLTNIIKHADATTVSLSIKKEKQAVQITLIDNGKGFNMNSKSIFKSLGLKTLRERVKMLKGTLLMESQINKGTTVMITIPITL